MDVSGAAKAEKKGGKEKGRQINKAARRTKASETHTTVTPPQARRGSRADHREWRADSSSKAEPPSAES